MADSPEELTTNIPLIAINRQHMSHGVGRVILKQLAEEVVEEEEESPSQTFQRSRRRIVFKIPSDSGSSSGCFIHKPFYLFGKYSLMICCENLAIPCIERVDGCSLGYGRN